MNHLSDADRIQLVRYLTGESTPEERVEVERWSTDDPQWGQQFEHLRQSWEACSPDPLAYDHEALWVSLQRMIRADAEPVPKHAAGRMVRGMGVLGRQPLRGGMWSAVTALAVCVIVTVVGWMAGAYHVRARTAGEMLTYTTGNGERATITLPDSGTVALNVASRLDVPLDYMAGNHTLRLVGEGLFTVPHHEGTPVTVVAGTTRARVLGTSFVVRRYATDTAVLVAVRDGKVAVGTTVLAAAQAADVGRDGVPQMRSADASLFTFATGVLTIDGLPLPAAIVELDRWYDVDIRLGDPKLATLFLKGQNAAGSLGDLEEILELTLDVRVVRDGRILTLFPRR